MLLQRRRCENKGWLNVTLFGIFGRYICTECAVSIRRLRSLKDNAITDTEHLSHYEKRDHSTLASFFLSNIFHLFIYSKTVSLFRKYIFLIFDLVPVIFNNVFIKSSSP